MENKRYYWLKLKNDFFTDKRIKKLRKIAGGDTYTIIYLKMQLLSLQEEGNLYFENVEETFEEEIALQIDEDYDDVKLTIAYLLNSGLLVPINKNCYELIETKNCIGSETRNAESMRKLREKKKEDVTMLQNVTKCYIEKEIEKEKEKELDIEKDIKHKYGEYQHVLLTDKQLEELKKEYSNYEELIKYLDEYIEMKGYKAKNHYLAIKKWVVSAVKENTIRNNKINNSQSKNAFAELLEEENDEQKRNIINVEYIEKCIS